MRREGQKKEVRRREHSMKEEKTKPVRWRRRGAFLCDSRICGGGGVCPKGEWWSLGTVGPSSP